MNDYFIIVLLISILITLIVIHISNLNCNETILKKVINNKSVIVWIMYSQSYKSHIVYTPKKVNVEELFRSHGIYVKTPYIKTIENGTCKTNIYGVDIIYEG